MIPAINAPAEDPAAVGARGYAELIARLQAWRGHDPVIDRELSDLVLLADGWWTEPDWMCIGRKLWCRGGDRHQYRVNAQRPHPVCDFVAVRAMLPQPVSYCMAYVAGEASATIHSLQHGRSFIGHSSAETVALLIAIFRLREYERQQDMLQTPAGAA